MLSLSHTRVTTNLPVRDMSRARSFYEGKLGFSDPDTRPGDGSLVYHLDGTDLALMPREEGTKAEHTAVMFEVPDMPFEFKPQHDFDLHLALEVAPEVLVPMLEKARREGIEVRGISDHGFIDSIYFRDPNGYVVELCAKRVGHDAMMDPARNGAREKLDRWTAAKAAQPQARA